MLLLAGLAAPAGAQLGLGNGDRLAAPLSQLPEPGAEERLIPDDAPARSEERSRSARHVSRAQAASQAREAHGGRVLSVHWTGKNYRVKLLRRGEVHIVHIDDAPPERQQQ